MRPSILRACLLVLLVLIPTPPARAEARKGEVVGVVDGATLTLLLKDGSQRMVRLLGVAVPETGHCPGARARAHLARLLAGRTVILEFGKRDADGNILGRVMLDGRDVAPEIIRAGFGRYSKEHEGDLSAADRQSYAAAEDEARRDTKGLWSDRPPQPPCAEPDRPATEDRTVGPSPVPGGGIVFVGQAAEVLGGNSIAVKMSDYSRKVVCINSLEVPEPGQPYADVAQQHLKDLLLGREVTVSFRGIEEDTACLLADVYLGAVNVNLQMVRDGVGWINKNYYYPEGYYVYEQAEQAARGERRGIWQDTSPTPPWVYRGEQTAGGGWASGGGYSGGGYPGGVSGRSSPGKDVHVRGHYRNGSYVRPHTRSAPGRGAGRGGSSGGRGRRMD